MRVAVVLLGSRGYFISVTGGHDLGQVGNTLMQLLTHKKLPREYLLTICNMPFCVYGEVRQ